MVESDSKAAKKVQVGTSSKPKVLYKHWSKEKMVLLGSIHATKAGQGQRKWTNLAGLLMKSFMSVLV